jgi:excisionase family DNA binding protein
MTTAAAPRQPSTEFEPLLAVVDVAGVLGVSPQTVRRLIKDRKLRGVWVASNLKVSPAELRSYILRASTDGELGR